MGKRVRLAKYFGAKMNELSYFTTEELVNELLTRTTFCGILIRSNKEVRECDYHKVWNMEATPNLTPKQVHDILSDITEQLGEKISKFD